MSKSDSPKKLTREERLAEQLRANLRRRKAATKRQKASAELSKNSEDSSD